MEIEGDLCPLAFTSGALGFDYRSLKFLALAGGSEPREGACRLGVVLRC
jgi:hypothetical protein